jgi:hypothetical protein
LSIGSRKDATYDRSKRQKMVTFAANLLYRHIMNLHTTEHWHFHTDAALDWVRRSIEACSGAGSSHSWMPIRGWAKAYPETTGYLLETLVDYHTRPNRANQPPTDAATIEQLVRWLAQIQMPNGAWAGLLAGHDQPSVFNTAQILMGLARVHEAQIIDYQVVEMLDRATAWLCSILDQDGAWRQAAYVPGYVPAYYTRAVWGVLRANDVLQAPRVTESMRHAMTYYIQKIRPDGWVHDLGFGPDTPAFTHTIAYTLEGFWEVGRWLDDEDITRKALKMSDLIFQRTKKDGFLAGQYTPDLLPAGRFKCLTGLAQLAILYDRMGQATQEPYRSAFAKQCLDDVLRAQVLRPSWGASGRMGGLAGSDPLWGPYMRFRYPNWAVKFLLDALWLARPAGMS